MSRIIAGFAVVVLLAPSLAQASPQSSPLTLQPFTLKAFDGQQLTAELGTLIVTENRSLGSKRKIEVAFVRLPHRGNTPGAPIFFLPPGPGIPSTTLGRVPPYFQLFDRLRDFGDVILLDIRGEGMSTPNLDECPAQPAVSPHAFETFETLVHQWAASVSYCAQYWRSRGVDLSAYNNREIAEDIHELRLALNYPRISLLGFSAGTDLGVVLLARHGNEIDRVVFAATGAATLKPRLPSTYDQQLLKVAYAYKMDGDSGSDLVALFDEGVKALDSKPALLTLTEGPEKRPVQVRVGSVTLKAVVAELLNGSVSMLPALLTSVRKQDYSLLQIFVQKMFNGFHGSMTLIGRTIDCSNVVPAYRLARVQEEAGHSRFGNIRNIHLQPSVCRAAVGFSLRTETGEQPWFSPVPVLFVSGSMDANTPPFDAETLRWAFPKAAHIVVGNGFHETLPSPDVQGLAVDFFAGRDVAGHTVTFERPKYLSLEEARAAAQHAR